MSIRCRLGFHAWRVVRARHLYKQNYQPFTQNWDGTPVPRGGSPAVTVVLYACSCGARKTTQVDGHWSSEDIKAGGAA